MDYNYWPDGELYKHVAAEQLQRTAADSSSQPQQNYLAPVPVNPHEDPTLADTHDQDIYGGDSTSNHQLLAPADLHDASLTQSGISGLLPSDTSVPHYASANISDTSGPCPISPSSIPAIHQSPTALLHSHSGSYHDNPNHLREDTFCGQELPHNNVISQSKIQCGWHNPQKQCNVAVDTVKSMIHHIKSDHLPKCPQRCLVECLLCSPPTTMRRDTIFRHIREQHYGDNSRRKHSLDDPAL